jgi:hypothetical protein
MRSYVRASLAIVACVAVGTFSYAATLWPDGDNTNSNQGEYGFVGKGELQIPWGWNNAKLQSEADFVLFTYEEVGTYTVICDGHSNPSQNPRTFSNKVVGIEASVARELRKNSVGQVTGFSLIDIGDELATGEGCPTAWTIEVDRIPNEDAGTVIGLVAHHPDEDDLPLDTEILFSE